MDDRYIQSANWQSTNSNSQIDFVFLQISLSIFFWNWWIKTFLLSEFLSLGKPRSFSLYFSLDNFCCILLQKMLHSTQFFCIWIAFCPKTPMDQIITGTTHEILADHFWKDNLNHDIFLSVVSGETPELRCKSEEWFVTGKGGRGGY